MPRHRDPPPEPLRGFHALLVPCLCHVESACGQFQVADLVVNVPQMNVGDALRPRVCATIQHLLGEAVEPSRIFELARCQRHRAQPLVHLPKFVGSVPIPPLLLRRRSFVVSLADRQALLELRRQRRNRTWRVRRSPTRIQLSRQLRRRSAFAGWAVATRSRSFSRLSRRSLRASGPSGQPCTCFEPIVS